MSVATPTQRLNRRTNEHSLLDRGVRDVALRMLSRMHDGELVLAETGGATLRVGRPAADGLEAVVRVHSPAFYRSLLGGSLGAGRAYIDGLWDCDDLVTLVRIANRNMETVNRLQAAGAPLLRCLRSGRSWLRQNRNTPLRNRHYVEQHYDLGDDLFTQMLDESMSYSCALFEAPGASLHEAQVAKMERLCAKLALHPGDHLLEIGTGWGGLAVHAATRYGCRVTTTTLSREQHAAARARAARAGVADRVTVLLEDYRELSGSYEKLVSVEMIEAIGWRYFDTFFATVSDRLVEGGTAVIQAICQPHREYLASRDGATFINTYIFPGGHCPSVEQLVRSSDRAGGLRMIHLEDITDHYVPTLRAWRDRFVAAADRLDGRFDARFRRAWMLYLSLCEAGFAEHRISDVQLILSKSAHRPDALAAA